MHSLHSLYMLLNAKLSQVMQLYQQQQQERKKNRVNKYFAISEAHNFVKWTVSLFDTHWLPISSELISNEN